MMSRSDMMSKSGSVSSHSSITSEDHTESDKSLVQDDALNNANLESSLNEESIILVQFQPQFQAVVMSGMLLSYLGTIVDATFAFATEEKNIPLEYVATLMGIIYCIDAIYVIDIWLMIAFRSSKWAYLKHLYDKRSIMLIILDIISVVPLDAVYFSLTEASMKLIYFLRLRYALRIFRFLIKINKLKGLVGYNTILIELMVFFLQIIISITTASCIIFLVECQFQECEYIDKKIFRRTFHSVYEEATNQGFPNNEQKLLVIELLLLAIKFIAFIYINGYIVAAVLIELCYNIRQKYIFQNMQAHIIRNMKICGCKDELIISTAKQFCATNWNNRQGFSFNEFDQSILPEAMLSDLNLDIFWDALKHSHLFRDKDVSFLRVLSSIMVQKDMIPGEVIFQRGQLKSSMIYVVSGVIQILSELDAETPIISLTRGTCIGEVSLMQSNPAISTVVCHNSCKLIILDKKHLVSIILKHRNEFRVLRDEIKIKCSEVNEFEHYLNDMFNDENNKREILSLKWLKLIFKELTAKYEAISNQGRNILTLNERNTLDMINLQLFNAVNIDMLVICEEIELVTDTVFMKVNFPCIIQPDSFVVDIWNNLISWTILIYICVYPYYASFQPITSRWFDIWSFFILLLWFLDIYITLSTAIKTSDHIISNFSEIVYMKISKPSFIVDMLSVIPLGVLTMIIMDIPSQMQVLLQFPKLFKFYKIQYIFKESLSMIDDISRAYLEFMVYLLLLIYYFAAVLHLHACYNLECNQYNIHLGFIESIVKNKTYPVIMWIYISTQQIANLGMPLNVEGEFYTTFDEFISAIELSIIAFGVYFTSNSVSTVAMKKYQHYKLHNYIFNLKVAMKDLSVESRLQNQVLRHIEGHLQFNDCFNILYSASTLQRNFHKEIYEEFRNASYSDYIKRIPIFEQLPDNVISSIAQAFRIDLMVPNEVITYYGEICTEMHTIINGFCAIVTNTGKISKILKAGDHITDIEFFFKIPVANTIISLTHCKLLSVKYGKMMHSIQKYPTTLWEINNTIDIIKNTVNINALYVDGSNFALNIVHDDKPKSFINIGYMSRDTNESLQYYAYFDEHEFLGFLKYILLRSVFTPYGNFIKYWEVSRCIFAFMTIIFTPMITINPCTNCVWIYFLYFLDVTAWIDIYIRHHIIYFNNINIEIIHPIKTSLYYWKHTFIIDLIAVLPFEIIVGSFISDNQTKAFLRVPRFLQSYRIFGAINYLSYPDLNIPIKLWAIIKFIPFLVILINVTAYIYMNTICEFSPNIPASAVFEKGVKCDDESWIVQSKFEKPFSPFRVHLYGLLCMSIILLRPAIGGFTIVNQKEAVQVVILTIIGLLIYMYIASKIIAKNLFRSSELPAYQQGMSSLIKFLTYKRIDPKLRMEVINHFEYIWKKQKSKHLCATIAGSCNQALEADVLFDVFGTAMTDSIIFKGAPNAFFKGILLHSKHEIIMKRGIVTQVNNVHGDIYIIFKGRVEVLGPDYNRLLVLSVGSLFGNIGNQPMSRQTLTMVAKGHVELLTIQSKEFHHVLSKYPHLRVQYHRLIGINADYLLGTEDKALSDPSLVTLRELSRIDTNVSLKSIVRLENVLNNILEEHSKIMLTIWESFVLIFPCFLGLIVESYIHTVIDTSIYFIVVLYVFDALFIIKIISTFFISFEDEFGILVTDWKKIAKAYIHDRQRFPLHIASIFPFEIIALFFQTSTKFWRIWIHCRSNRFIRVYFILNYLNKKTQQLNINVKVTRTLTMILWMCIFLQTLTSVLIAITCLNPDFNTTPVLKCDWLNMKSKEKLEIYQNHLTIVLNLFATSSMGSYVVNSSFLVVYIIVLLLCCKLIQISMIVEIAATLNRLYEIKGNYEDNIKLLKQHMIREHTSPALLERIWLYVCILWKTNEGLQFPKFLKVAPYYLREAVLNSLFGYHLRKHPILGKCHVDLLRQMAAQMETRMFLNDDYVAFSNDYDECMYFVHEGTVDALTEDDMESEKIEFTYRKNSMFGLHQGLYLQSGHEYSYRAIRYTIIVVLKRSKWIHLLEFFPASKEILYNEVKQIM